jgi:hypothetical protein
VPFRQRTRKASNASLWRPRPLTGILRGGFDAVIAPAGWEVERREVHMRRGWWVLISGLLLAGSGCGHGGTAGAAPQPDANPVRVEVTNNYALPLEIYAVASGINQRLGVVYPGTVGHFNLPPALIGNGSVEFQARPTEPGRQQFRSGPILLAAGETVDFVITPQLFNSTATLRP